MSAMPELPEHQEHPEPDPAEGPAAADKPVPPGPADASDADADADHAGSAGAGGGAPQAGPATDDELFAQLIAGFDDPVEAGSRTWPEAEDVSDLAPAPRNRPSIMQLPVVRALPPVDPRAWSAAEDPDDEHFVPPPPEPLPRPEAPTRLAIAALVLGLVLIGLYLVGELPGLGAILGGCSFLGGAGTLVSRLRVDEDDDDPDPHNGAVV
jgi:hypothetical protein